MVDARSDPPYDPCHFSLREKSSASEILRMHKISPSGRDDIFFIYVMKFWFRLGRVRYNEGP